LTKLQIHEDSLKSLNELHKMYIDNIATHTEQDKDVLLQAVFDIVEHTNVFLIEKEKENE